MVEVRLIKKEDNPAVASIIRTVMPEFGASGKGFAIHDKEVDDMFGTYTQPRSVYYVCEDNGVVIGGGGVGPLVGGDPSVCELKKMYFKVEARGKGFGERVLKNCISFARQAGYKQCYLETFNTMTGAMKLYEKSGFRKIAGPQGNTGHFACDTFYLLDL